MAASLYALGLNHQTAPLAVRERVVFHVERLREALAELTRGLAREAAILSTCNRTELYVAGDEPEAAAQWLARYHRFRPEGLSPYLYTLPREHAGRHAFRVAAGLHSIELCATHFAAQGPARITVANRTLERGEKLAHRFNGRPIELRSLADHLHEYDIVVSSTASSLPILGKGLVERALRARRRRPMFMVDLAVPRDIEPEVGELDDVFLYTVDDLAEIVSLNLDARRSAVDQAEAIIESQVGQFMHWMQARDNVPLIRALREHAEHARRGEVERALKLLQRGEDAARVLESLSQALTNKLMHGPTQALNDAAGDERRALADTLARLFRVK